jgi:hypothetical protein
MNRQIGGYEQADWRIVCTGWLKACMSRQIGGWYEQADWRIV